MVIFYLFIFLKLALAHARCVVPGATPYFAPKEIQDGPLTLPSLPCGFDLNIAFSCPTVSNLVPIVTILFYLYANTLCLIKYGKIREWSMDFFEKNF